MSTTAENKIYQGIWKKALQTGEVSITFPTKGEAHSARFGLYNAVKRVKAGLDIDPELLQATKECSVQMSGNTVGVIKSVNSPRMQALIAALGGVEVVEAQPEPVSAEEKAIQESISKTLEKIKEDEEGPLVERRHRTTPYYTRED